MQTLSDGDGDDNHDPVPGHLKRVCLLGRAAEHPKLKALALSDFKGLGRCSRVCLSSGIVTHQ